MNKTILAIASVAALSAAALPATAQSYRGGHGWGHSYGHNRPDPRNNINERQSNLTATILRGERSRQLTPREAAQLRAEVREIDWMQRRFRADGSISAREYAALDARIETVAAHVRAELYDRETRYGSGYGRW